MIVNEYEEVIEDWYYEHQDQDLADYLCRKYVLKNDDAGLLPNTTVLKALLSASVYQMLMHTIPCNLTLIFRDENRFSVTVCLTPFYIPLSITRIVLRIRIGLTLIIRPRED